MMEFDIIVVGSGTAGCAVARRLAERTDLRCLLIEAGPAYPGWALSAPLASLRLRKLWSWPAETVPQEQLLGRKIELPMGRVAGGTSAVNAMIAVEGPAADFDHWATNGCPGWSWADLQPGLERAASRSGNAMLLVSDPGFVSDRIVSGCMRGGRYSACSFAERRRIGNMRFFPGVSAKLSS
jgi:choline dehydrogenase-like flavoprotein